MVAETRTLDTLINMFICLPEFIGILLVAYDLESIFENLIQALSQ